MGEGGVSGGAMGEGAAASLKDRMAPTRLPVSPGSSKCLD